MNGKVSHVKQYLEEQEKRSREKPNVLPCRKARSSSLDGRTSIPIAGTNGSKNRSSLATFTNCKKVSGTLLVLSWYYYHSSFVYICCILIPPVFNFKPHQLNSKKQFSYVRQYLLEQEEEERMEQVLIFRGIRGTYTDIHWCTYTVN